MIGNDPKKWRTNVPTYGRVRYENIYPGVDLVYYGKQGGQLKYDFVVDPGADASAITLAIDAEGQVSSMQKAVGSGQSSAVSRQRSEVGHNHPGTGDEVGNSGHLIPQSKMQNRKSKIASSLRIAANGDLIVTAKGGEVWFHKPVVYQTESIRLRRNSRQSKVESRAAKEENRQSPLRGGIRCPLQPPTESRQRTTDHGQLTSTNPESEIKIQN